MFKNKQPSNKTTYKDFIVATLCALLIITLGLCVIVFASWTLSKLMNEKVNKAEITNEKFVGDDGLTFEERERQQKMQTNQPINT